MSDALQRLIEAVEAGEGTGVAFHARAMASAARDVGDCWPAFEVVKAFTGNLIAAVSLAENLLPGWDWAVAKIGERSDAQICPPQGPTHTMSEHCGPPSRALLILTLKAYQEGLQ